MFYGIILSNVSSNDPTNDDLKGKLRCNLWLALNDVRLLLEPSEANIQALIVLACHVEEFTTPSLSWLLITNACRMLQALGVNHRQLDSKTRERRAIVFWHLNLLDKGFALVFGRPPTFHRAMANEIKLPTLEQLLPFQPHQTSTIRPSTFGVHFLHQMFRLTRTIADIWYCLFDGPSTNDDMVAELIERVNLWYCDARKVGTVDRFHILVSV